MEADIYGELVQIRGSAKKSKISKKFIKKYKELDKDNKSHQQHAKHNNTLH